VHALITDVPIGALTLVIILDIVGQPMAADVALTRIAAARDPQSIFEGVDDEVNPPRQPACLRHRTIRDMTSDRFGPDEPTDPLRSGYHGASGAPSVQPSRD
jgi:hypothetical protein